MPKEAKGDFPLLMHADELVEGLRDDVPRALREWDEKAIHDARVATRRLKALLDLLGVVLSSEQRKPFGRVLRKLRRRLGPLRDLDVMAGHLEELGKSPTHLRAIAWLTERLDRQRAAERERSADQASAGAVLGRLGIWWGLREQVREAKEAVDSLLAQSLHEQLDAFAGRADHLAQGPAEDEAPQDPHELRIAGKALRYTLEMAATEGHRLPAAVLKTFKRMQEQLGLWHDYVVLSERAMQMSLEELLPHHDAAMQARVLDLAKALLNRAARHLERFSAMWSRRGAVLASNIRDRFPLTVAASSHDDQVAKPEQDGLLSVAIEGLEAQPEPRITASKMDPDPAGSDEIPVPAAPSAGVPEAGRV